MPHDPRPGNGGIGMLRLTVIVLAGLLAAPRASAAADSAAGQVVFNKCRICHTVKAGERSTVGPNLHGVFGRHAGSLERFPYSPAMKNSGIVWDDASMAAFVRDPRKAIPGNRMAFPGIKNDENIADLLAYLHQATQ
jgi:cytochrome c